MDIEVRQHRLGEAPYRVVQPVSGGKGRWVVVQHGYTGSLETETPVGMKFAEAGLTVVVTEAAKHGLRKTDKTDAEFATDFQRTIGAVVEQSVVELRALMDHLGIERAGFFGTSMGGYIGYRLASEDERIRVFCPVVSSPVSYWADYTDEDEAARIRFFEVSLHPERIQDRAILIQNGALDEAVPTGPSQRLFALLQASMPPDRLKMIEYPGIGHELTSQMIGSGVEWVQRHLREVVG